MTRSVRVAIAAVWLLVGTSLATAKVQGVAGVHGNARPGSNETTARRAPAEPYYRLSDPYYGYSDPYFGLFDFYAVPPYSPGYSYRHVTPEGSR